MKTLSKSLVITLALGALAACGDSSNRYLLEDAAPAREMRTAVRLIQVETMNLPDYFSSGEILVQNEQGVLKANKKDLWADTPDRGFTEQFATGLDARLTADVASSPWPFELPADIKVEIKVRRFVARNDGTLEFKGQYFLSSNYGGALARAKRFELTEQVVGEGYPAITSAYGRALSQLSDIVARDITRIRTGEF